MIEIRFNDFQPDPSALRPGYFLYDPDSHGGEVLEDGFKTEEAAAAYRDELIRHQCLEALRRVANDDLTVEIARELIQRPDARPVVGRQAVTLGMEPTTVTLDELRELLTECHCDAVSCQITVEELWHVLPTREQALWDSGIVGARAAAQLAQGMHYQTSAARFILLASDVNWADVWPVVDGNGHLTGEIATGDSNIFVTDDGLAAIDPDEAFAAGWVIDDEQLTAALPSATRE
jgi:hypothetical protein